MEQIKLDGGNLADCLSLPESIEEQITVDELEIRLGNRMATSAMEACYGRLAKAQNVRMKKVSIFGDLCGFMMEIVLECDEICIENNMERAIYVQQCFTGFHRLVLKGFICQATLDVIAALTEVNSLDIQTLRGGNVAYGTLRDLLNSSALEILMLPASAFQTAQFRRETLPGLLQKPKLQMEATGERPIQIDISDGLFSMSFYGDVRLTDILPVMQAIDTIKQIQVTFLVGYIHPEIRSELASSRKDGIIILLQDKIKTFVIFKERQRFVDHFICMTDLTTITAIVVSNPEILSEFYGVL